ncbi:hypothetical protein E3N88_36174 [Mikania micrantha]|uniref:Uncharacterized protein n=1 Tax=Mikania micrantha TaxID=192012 RepID=A0A5N6M2Y8_9ASTR|nr:hypothetical protein E3N88_36174 [Mikania micrantha]
MAMVLVMEVLVSLRCNTTYEGVGESSSGPGRLEKVESSNEHHMRQEPIKKNQARKLETAERRMLRWMCGHTRLDRIRNEVFRERLQVANISDKVREGRLRWFGHVRRRSQPAPVRKVELLTVEGKRGRGRPRLTWDEQIRQDLTELHLSEDMIYDRSTWRRRIKVQDT